MNKQIEEMAKDLNELHCTNRCKNCIHFYNEYEVSCVDMCFAEKLHAKGYRKQVEGEWIEDEVEADCPTHFFHNYTCSVCGNREQDRSPYCRECGSRMRG